jgi:predicted  nucleic acid-binding Zn-ribbon protein
MGVDEARRSISIYNRLAVAIADGLPDFHEAVEIAVRRVNRKRHVVDEAVQARRVAAALPTSTDAEQRLNDADNKLATANNELAAAEAKLVAAKARVCKADADLADAEQWRAAAEQSLAAAEQELNKAIQNAASTVTHSRSLYTFCALTLYLLSIRNNT